MLQAGRIDEIVDVVERASGRRVTLKVTKWDRLALEAADACIDFDSLCAVLEKTSSRGTARDKIFEGLLSNCKTLEDLVPLRELANRITGWMSHGNYALNAQLRRREEELSQVPEA